jgi:hypothetical protein
MKNTFSSGLSGGLLAACFLLLFSGCTVTTPVGDSLNDSYLLHVECVKDAGTRREVLMLLHQCRAKDLHEDDLGGDLIIEAAYYKSDNSLGSIERICDNLRQIPSVTHLEIRDNPRLVRENR